MYTLLHVLAQLMCLGNNPKTAVSARDCHGVKIRTCAASDDMDAALVISCELY